MKSNTLKALLKAQSMTLRSVLTLSLVAPAGALANSREDINQYFQSSKEYNQKYFRLLELNATAGKDISFLEVQIPLQRQAVTAAEATYQEKKSALDAIVVELQQNGQAIEQSQIAMESAETAIAETVSAARASEDFVRDAEITTETLDAKVAEYQVSIDKKDSEISAKSAEIRQIKQDPAYSSDVRERNSLQTEQSNAISDVAAMTSENASLRDQIATERTNITTWRQIQRTTSNQISDITSIHLPPLRAEKRSLEDRLGDVDAEQRDAIFTLQQTRVRLRDIRGDEANQVQVVRAARAARNKDQRTLDDLNETLRRIPKMRRRAERLQGEVSEINSQLRNINSSIESNNTKISTAQAQKSTAQSQKASAESAKSDLQSQIRALNERIADLERQKDNLAGAPDRIREINQQIRRLRGKVESLQSEIASLNEQVLNKQARVQQINQRIREINELLERGNTPNQQDGEDSAQVAKRDREDQDRDRRGDRSDGRRGNDDGIDRRALRRERNELRRKRKATNDEIASLNQQISSKRGNIQTKRRTIASLRQEKERLESGGDQLERLNRQIRRATQERNGLRNQVPALNEQIAAAQSEIQNANRRISRLQNQNGELEKSKRPLNKQKRRKTKRITELNKTIGREDRMRQRVTRIRDRMRTHEREVRREENILGRIQDRIRDEELIEQRLIANLDDINREKDQLDVDLAGVERAIADYNNQLNDLVRRRDEAVEGEQASIAFIDRAERTIANNTSSIQRLQIRLAQIEDALPAIVERISAFETEFVAPLERQRRNLRSARSDLANSQEVIISWSQNLSDSEATIANLSEAIADLTERNATLTAMQPVAEQEVTESNSNLAAEEQALASLQQQVTDLTNEFNTIGEVVNTLEIELEQLLEEIKSLSAEALQEAKAAALEAGEEFVENPVELGNTAVVEDEEFEQDVPGSKRDWKSGVITNHKLTGSKACVAFTTVEDEAGQEVARLEVVMPEVPTLSGEMVYSEPTIRVVTSSADLFFLDGSLKTNRTDLVSMKYSAAEGQDNPIQGAVLDLEEKDYLVKRLRGDRDATLQLFDDQGMAVEYVFSLSGSQFTIGKAYEACGHRVPR